MGRILAIDFGKRNIGLAVSDETKIIAKGLAGIRYQRQSEVIEKLRTIIQEQNVEKIILGYPIAMSGKITQIGMVVLAFKQVLEQSFNSIPIELFDERLTTEQSKRIAQEMHQKRKTGQEKALLNRLSAIIILQDYLRLQNR